MNATLRWWAKKTGRMGCALLTGHAPDQPRQVRVLTYHRIADRRHDPFAVAPEAFEKQMHWLAEHGLAVSLARVRAFIAGRVDLPNGAVLVTIDDGYSCLRSAALPILRRYSIPAVAFISAGWVAASESGHGGEWLDWHDVRAVADAGVEIGSHGWSHRSFGRLTMDEVAEEASRSREEIERNIDTKVESLAYPFGTFADAGSIAAAITREAGYSCAFTSQHGAVHPGSNPFLLPRVKVEGGEPVWMFARACRGGMDAWSWVDRHLWQLQAAGG